MLLAVGVAMMWFRLSMNYNSQPIFKEEELKASFHPNRTVRYASSSCLLSYLLIVELCIVKHPYN